MARKSRKEPPTTHQAKPFIITEREEPAYHQPKEARLKNPKNTTRLSTGIGTPDKRQQAQKRQPIFIRHTREAVERKSHTCYLPIVTQPQFLRIAETRQDKAQRRIGLDNNLFKNTRKQTVGYLPSPKTKRRNNHFAYMPLPKVERIPDKRATQKKATKREQPHQRKRHKEIPQRRTLPDTQSP